MKKPDPERYRLAADNRKARFNYEIKETVEAGIALQGTEIKSLRGGKATIGESYAGPMGEELFLFNAYIPEYLEANRFNHEVRRPRKLLLHRREIDKLERATTGSGRTIVPLALYFLDGYAKVELAVGTGKKAWDKRQTIAERDANRDAARELAARNRGE